MNANELADYITHNAGNSIIGAEQAATMLRQLQAENEAEKLYSSMKHDEVLALQAEIESLKAEIKSIEKNTDYWADKSAKTLTDEEMYELLEKYQGIELCKTVLRKAQE